MVLLVVRSATVIPARANSCQPRLFRLFRWRQPAASGGAGRAVNDAAAPEQSCSSPPSYLIGCKVVDLENLKGVCGFTGTQLPLPRAKSWRDKWRIAVRDPLKYTRDFIRVFLETQKNCDALQRFPGVSQESPSTRLEELTSETPDSSKKQVALAETRPDSLGVLKRGLTVGP